MGELDIPQDNPAGRLVHFIRAVAASSGSNRLDQVLGQAFGLDPDDRALLTSRLSAVWQLVSDLETAIQDTGISQRYLTVMPSLKTYIGYFDSLGAVKPREVAIPDASMLAVLELCADELSQRNDDPYPSHDAVASLRNELRSLIDLVRESDIDPDLATYLLAQLHDLAAALDEFDIAGTVPPRRAFARVLGETQLTQRFENSEENRRVVRRFIDVLNQYGAVFQLTAAAGQIAQTVLLALPPGHH